MVDALAAMPWKAPQSIDAYELRSSKLLPVLLTVLVLPLHLLLLLLLPLHLLLLLLLPVVGLRIGVLVLRVPLML